MRQLSSQMTFFYKFVFAPTWIGAFTLATLSMAFSSEAHPELRSFALVTVLGSAFLYWAVGRLKRVELDGEWLVVSNYFKTVRIPLRDISEVGGSLLMSPELVWLSLSRPSPFGKKIVFMPPLRFSLGLSRHPIVGG
jgi:hypothetical protein